MKFFSLKYSSSLISIILFIALSCNFTPETEVFTEIDSPSLEGLAINLNNYSEIDILLKGETTFDYSIETKGKKLIETKVTLNGQIIWVSLFATGSFTLKPATLGTGTHKLKIEFIAESGTGSLAEQYGAEVLYVWTERNVVVDNSVPDDPGDANAIAITSVSNVDNSITVTWNKYNSFNFEQYELQRFDYDGNGNLVEGSPILFRSSLANDLSFNDLSYIGGRSEYKIKLYAAGKTYTSPPFVYDHPYQPNITTKINGDGTVTLKWNSLTPLSNNFRGYTIIAKYEVSGSTQKLTFNKSSLADTTLTFTPPPPTFKFGSVKDIEFIVDPQVDRQPSKYYFKMRYGAPFPTFIPVYVEPQFNEETNTYFFARHPNGRLYKVSQSGALLDSLQIQLTRIALNKSIGIGSTGSDKVYKIDLQTMTTEAMPAIPDGAVYALSENNRLLKHTSFEGTKAFDLNGNVLATIGFPPSDVRLISTDGNWLLAFGIYKWNSVTSQFDVTSNYAFSAYKSIQFIKDQPSILVGYTNKISKINLETLAVVTNNSYTGPCNRDNTTGLIGCLTGNQFVILDDNFVLQKNLSVDPNAGSFYLLNNTVLCTSGTQIKVSDIP